MATASPTGTSSTLTRLWRVSSSVQQLPASTLSPSRETVRLSSLTCTAWRKKTYLHSKTCSQFQVSTMSVHTHPGSQNLLNTGPNLRFVSWWSTPVHFQYPIEPSIYQQWTIKVATILSSLMVTKLIRRTSTQAFRSGFNLYISAIFQAVRQMLVQCQFTPTRGPRTGSKQGSFLCPFSISILSEVNHQFLVTRQPLVFHQAKQTRIST